MNDTILDVRDLRVEFPLARGLVRAVDGASFDLRRGEALGLVGESGSGKTMALRALVGLLPRQARPPEARSSSRAQTSHACRRNAYGRYAVTRSR